MRIFLTYILKSMLEKKSRLVLLLAAIALSGGTLIGSLGMVDVAIQTLGKSQMEAIEYKEISITSKKSNESFKVNHIKEIGIKNLVPQILKYITFGDKNEIGINLYGRENELIDTSSLMNTSSLNGFSNKKCIISIRTSDTYGWNVGDNIEVEINNKKVKLQVYAIAKNEGLFYADNKGKFVMITPYAFLADIYNMAGKYNYVTANKTEESIQTSVEMFNKANKNFEACELIGDSNTYVSQLSMPLYMMLVVMIFMSTIIIYSSFKLIITERLGIIGTFLSQGATKGIIRANLYLESLVYGIVGGIIGLGIGFGIVKGTSYAMSPLRTYGIIEKVEIPGTYYLVSIIFSIMLAWISAIVPILGVNKVQVKELILNTVSSNQKIGTKRVIIGVIIMCLTAVCNRLPYKWVDFMSPVLLISALIAIILIFPMIMVLISRIIFNRLKAHMPTISIALNNVSTSKVLINNITLLFITMFIVVMINSIGDSLQAVVRESYSSFNYGFQIQVTGGKYGIDVEGIQRLVKRNKDIIDIQEEYDSEANVNGKSAFSMGVDAEKYYYYNQYINWDMKEYEKFKTGDKRSAIITQKLAQLTNLEMGDMFNMCIDETTQSFKVVGIVDGKMYNDGMFVIIKKEAFEDLYKIKTPTLLTCKTKGAPEKIKELLQNEVSEKGGKIVTLEETIKANIDGNTQIFTILNIFSMMAIVVSALGILNNIGISFIQRKKSIVVLSSVGMSGEQRRKMLITESILTTLWPALILCIFGNWCMSITERLIVFMMDFEMKVEFNIALMPQIFITALIVVLAATIPIISENKRFNIVKELKFE